MQDFRRLKVWERAHRLVLDVYRATSGFPAAERFELTPQMRRAAASVSTNIAEGCGHHSDAELLRFLQMSMASASELEYQLLLARDLAYLDAEPYTALMRQTHEVKRMLASFLVALRRHRGRRHPHRLLVRGLTH